MKRGAVQQRKRAVRKLFLLEGLDASEIAERLLETGELVSRSFDSAARIVRGDVAELKGLAEFSRGEQDKADALVESANLLDPVLLRKLSRLNDAFRDCQKVIDDDSTVETVIDGPQGITRIRRPRFSATAIGKAIKDKSHIALRLAEVEQEIAEQRRRIIEEARPQGAQPGANRSLFAIAGLNDMGIEQQIGIRKAWGPLPDANEVDGYTFILSGRSLDELIDINLQEPEKRGGALEERAN